MTVVADTSILVDYLRGHEPARIALRSAFAERRVIASVVSRIEVLAGMRPDEEHHTFRLFDQVEWAIVDEEIAGRAGSLASRFGPSHRGVELADFVVAATVELYGATLWTTNRRHFPMFPDLPDPYDR